MDAYIKPDIQKTIKRLSQQKNNEVLKNKLRSWIITRELTVTELIRACRERTIQVAPSVLNKLGTLYGSGKEGLNEEPETAFVFYLAAADQGHPTAAGNVAQYYFDGRAPGGRNIDSAYVFCAKAVEAGADKFMLLSEILHEQRDYHETVRCLRKIIESKKTTDMKKRVDARKLEIQCLYKLLVELFVKAEDDEPMPSTPTLQALGNSSPSQYSQYSSYSPLVSSQGRRSLQSLPSPRTPLALGASLQATYRSMSSVPKAQEKYDYHHDLPGWTQISDELEGFDRIACSELTARAEVLELEAEALRSAYETAEQRVALGRKHAFSDDVISALMRSKVHEFHTLHQTLEANKTALLATWNYYTDTAEHTLRRQMITERRFFDPQRAAKGVLQLAKELFHFRCYDHPEYLQADWCSYYTPDKYLNKPLNLSTASCLAYHIPSARSLLTAERALLEVALATYPAEPVEHGQQTGWTGGFNLAITDDKEMDRSKLLQEMTYTETLVIGTAVLRCAHATHPVLPPARKDEQHELEVYENYYAMADLTCSDDLLCFLNHLTQVAEDAGQYQENERKLVDLIVRFLRDGKPFTIMELQAINEDVSENEICILTRIVFHYFVKRLVPWILPLPSAADAQEMSYCSSHGLPLACGQGRALQLVGMGMLTLSELFLFSSPYGIFYFGNDHQPKHTYQKLREQLIQINLLYQKAVLEASSVNFSPYVSYWKQHPHGQTVPSYRRLFRELTDIYGDAEEDEYDPYGADDHELEKLMAKLKI